MQDTEPVPVEPPRPANGVWAHIREHKILQWGTAYLGAALAIAQGTELLAGAFGWSASATRTVLVLLVIGFPIALTVAWYHGHRGLQQMSQGELAIVSVLLLIGAVFFTVSIRPSTEMSALPAAARAPAALDDPGEEARPPPNSIAVLPFANLSSDSEQEYFADGLAEEILNQLSKIEQLLVTARTSSFAYKGRTGDVGVIGRELGVGHVLEGSVRKAGNQVRITAQLIDTATSFHLWSETYEGELSDVFALQEEISRRVADALQVTLGVGSEEFRAGGTENTEAYDHYLLARSLLRLRTQDERARAELEQALALDTEFGHAQVALAQALIRMTANARTTERDELARQRDRAIDRAVAIAPDLPETFWLRAQRYMYQRDWPAAEKAVKDMWARSSPNDYAANVNYGTYLHRVGYAREALPYAQRARLLDPLVAAPYVDLGFIYDALGDHERAVATYEGIRTNVATYRGNDVTPQALRLLARGDVAAAQRVFEEYCSTIGAVAPCGDVSVDINGVADTELAELRAAYAQLRADDALRAGQLGVIAARFGDADFGAEAFGRGLLLDPVTWLQFAWIPTLGSVRRHPRFKEVVTEMKLVDYWRGSHWPERCRPLGERDFECF